MNHLPSTLLPTLAARAQAVWVTVWGVTSGVLGIFALLALFTLSGAAAFAVGSSVFLILMYLLYATPPQWTLYYYESAPAFAYLSAAGVAWAASMIGRPRGAPMSATFEWKSLRWNRAVAAGALVLAIPGLLALRMLHRQHADDRVKLEAFAKVRDSIPDRRAVLFVRYARTHNQHMALVRNVANLSEERIWVVYDRGNAENARLLALAPERRAYLFDEAQGQTYSYDPLAQR